MEVNRKLREELRQDSLDLRLAFWKLLYGESQAHNTFIPKRFEDLKLNGGIRLRRIPIKLNYHRSRFKKSRSPRRTLDLAVSLDRTELTISQRCVRVKTVRMKKQSDYEKKVTQRKLAQGCMSSGMFLCSPSFKNPKDYMQIRSGNRQIVDAGVKRETHLFVYGLTFLALMKIDCHVDTWIGDQSIFAEEVKALKHDDPEAAMESLQDVTSTEFELENPSEPMSSEELSQRGQRGFHKVRFKVRLHRRSKVATEKVTKVGEFFKLGDSKSLQAGRSKSHRRAQLEFSLFVGKIKGKPPEGVSDIRGDAVECKVFVSDTVGFNLESLDGNEIDTFSFSMCVKKQTLRPVKMFCGRQPYESYLANQVWKPGGDGDDSSLCLSMLFGNCKEVSDNDGGKETDLKRWLNCFEELNPSRVLYVWDPGQARAAKKLLELLKSPHSKKNLVNGVEAETLEQEHDSGGSFSGLVFEVCVADTGWKRGVGALEMLTLDPGELAGLTRCWDVKWRTWLNCFVCLAPTEFFELKTYQNRVDAEEIRSTRSLQRVQWDPGQAMMLNDKIKQGQVRWLRLTSQQNGDIIFGLGNAETSEQWERVEASVIYSRGQDKERDGGNELYIEVKCVNVLRRKRSLASHHRTNSGDGLEIMGFRFSRSGFGHVQGSGKDAKVLAFDPGGASGEKAQELAFDKGGLVTLTMAADFYQLEDKLVLNPGSMHKNTEYVVMGYVWDPGRSVLAYDVASMDDGKTRDGSYQQQGQLHLPRPPEPITTFKLASSSQIERERLMEEKKVSSLLYGVFHSPRPPEPNPTLKKPILPACLSSVLILLSAHQNPILPSSNRNSLLFPTMDLSKVVSFSRNFAVLVKLEGPDPKGLKMRKHAFHQYHSGSTTLSASGMLFPTSILSGEAKLMSEDGQEDMALVLTVASLVEPFLTLGHRTSVSQDPVKLIPGARIEVMVEGQLNSDKEDPFWVPAQLLSLVDVPVSSAALKSLIETSLGSKDSGWDVGWSLVSGDTDSQPSTNMKHYSKPLMQRDEPNDAMFMAKSATRMALLGVSLSLLDQPNINIASPCSKGDTLVTLGSPFGILSPLHFFNSVSTGSISNCYSSGSLKNSLMIADVRCLPGMEGAPVFGKNGHLIGILIRPLRQKNSGVEVQLVVPWGAITAAACSHLLPPSDEGIKASHRGNDSTLVQVAVEKAMESICLISVNDGVWASGVILNEHGLILTNAHLLEPWRFGKGGVYGEGDDNGLRPHVLGAEEFSSTRSSSRFWEHESQTLPRKAPADIHVKKYKHSFLQSGNRDIRVRLCHQDSWTWCPAKVVYICKKQLDVALLQLEDVPGKLQPIAANFASPPLGTPAHVVGHGLFGPRCGLSPSICSGVVAKVVHTKKGLYTQPIFQDTTEFPAMLETTAAVHPGGSGGAVVNSSGHMIGLVTSNARHGAGTIIPHLNFSIPCAVLAPIFKFAEDMQNMEILQTLDQPNEELSSIWALMPSLSPKPKPNTEHSLPKLLKEGNNKQKKGSQFAKFIAETQEMFVKPTKLSRDVIPSKL